MDGTKRPLINNQVSATFEQTSKLEKELGNVLRKKSPSDKTVTQLRLSIRQNYESIILEDIDFASHRDVDQLLWKCVYYRPIEEFRKIIKKYHQQAFGDSSVQQQPDQNNALANKEKLHKACAAFKTFLEEGETYYEGLFNKIKQLYEGYKLANETRLGKMCLTSLHKCLIIRGDLARYTQLYNEQPEKDWSQAQVHYVHALAILPNNGNPHNQLAVVATYQDNSCEAIYRYFRSLAVKKPFVSARENLILLFEKNRQKYIAQHQQLKEERSNSRGGRGRGRGGDSRRGDRSSSQNTHMPAAELKQRFLTAFVRLHGIIFTKTSMETFDNVQQETMEMLGQLNIPSGSNSDDEHEDYLSDSLVLKLVLMNIYSIENTASYQVKQHNPYLENACSLAFNTFQILCQHAVETTPNYAYLGSLITFIQYIDQHREHTIYQFRDMAKNTMWHGLASLLQTVGSNQSAYNNMVINDELDISTVNKERRLPEDIELSGFLPIKTDNTSRSGSSAKPITGPLAIEARVNRLNQFVTRLINDDRTDIYFDYEKGTYTTDRVENIKPIPKSPLRQPVQAQQPKRAEPIPQPVFAPVVEKVPSPKQSQRSIPQEDLTFDDDYGDFMSKDLMGGHTVMDDNELLDEFDEEGLDAINSGVQQQFDHVIERPFGTSIQQPTNNGWGNIVNGSPSPATGNLMSKLLQPSPQQPQQQQQPKQDYSSLFSTLYSGEGSNGGLFGNGDTWAPMDNKNTFAGSSLFGMPSQNRGNVIERPFQQPIQAQQPHQIPYNGIIEAPFAQFAPFGSQQQQKPATKNVNQFIS
jgi:hypothetical protein